MTGKTVESVVGGDNVALEVGAVWLGFGGTFGDGERFLEVGLGNFVLAEGLGESPSLSWETERSRWRSARLGSARVRRLRIWSERFFGGRFGGFDLAKGIREIFQIG